MDWKTQVRMSIAWCWGCSLAAGADWVVHDLVGETLAWNVKGSQINLPKQKDQPNVEVTSKYTLVLYCILMQSGNKNQHII